MAQFCKPIEKSFVCRTNTLIQEYNKTNLDATFLLNCMLGLLVVPFEKYNNDLKCEERTSVIRDMFDQLQADGKYNDYKNDYSDFDILRNLRNAIAHFNVDAILEKGDIEGFRFVSYEMSKSCPEDGKYCDYVNVPDKEDVVFSAELTLKQIKELAGYIKDYVLVLQRNPKCSYCDYGPSRKEKETSLVGNCCTCNSVHRNPN